MTGVQTCALPICQQAANTLLEGPVVDKARTDVVHNQEQVDELLGSLGF